MTRQENRPRTAAGFASPAPRDAARQGTLCIWISDTEDIGAKFTAGLPLAGDHPSHTSDPGAA